MKTDFPLAVHALVYLNHKQIPLSSKDLAENICTNPARVRKVMTALKHAGMVTTKEGAYGGYTLCGNTAALTLRKISEAVDTCFISTSWKSGLSDMECLVASGMGEIMDNIFAQLNEVCKEQLQEITIGDIDSKIFSTPKETTDTSEGRK